MMDKKTTKISKDKETTEAEKGPSPLRETGVEQKAEADLSGQSEAKARLDKAEDEQRMEKALNEAKENYNKWLYLKAEFENYKKRSHKEKSDLIKYGYKHFARELLHGVDSLETALSHVSTRGVSDDHKKEKALEEGIRLTLKQFVGVFSQFGLKPIESLGKKFDPKIHQAIAEEEREDQEAGTIISEHRKGYLIHDQLLRAAHVVIAKKKEVADKETENKDLKNRF